MYEGMQWVVFEPNKRRINGVVACPVPSARRIEREEGLLRFESLLSPSCRFLQDLAVCLDKM